MIRSIGHCDSQRTPARAAVVGVLVLALVLLLLPSPRGSAQVTSPQEAIPRELLMGTLGGAAGGALGFFGTFALCLYTGKDTTGWGPLICALLGLYGYGIGVPVGAVLGVNLTGNGMGLQGNVFLSVLEAVAGLGAGVLALAALGEATPGDDLLLVATALVAVPFLSALGATLGYNVGARVRARSEGVLVP